MTVSSKCFSALSFWAFLEWNTSYCECGLFYFRKLKSLTLFKDPLLPTRACTDSLTHSDVSFEYCIVSVLEGNRIWRTDWSYKTEQHHIWPGFWWCFRSFLQQFAMSETKSWVWSWSLLNSENMLVLDSLWKQPFGQYQLPFQGIATLASR